MKPQIPSSNIQRSTKPQAVNDRMDRRQLDVGPWNFSGAWMLMLGVFLSIALTSCVTRKPSTKPNFAVEQRLDRLIITHDSNPLAHFVFADTNILRPYFAHVHTLDGIQVTRNHPPIAGVDPVDHPTMHPGIWLAFGNISGQDFWRNKAKIRHERFEEKPVTSKDRLSFSTVSSMIGTNGNMLAKLDSYFSIFTLTNGYLLEWTACFSSANNDFFFGDQEEMGFGARVATPLSEKNGGTVRNSDGLTGAKNAWGKTALWCDYSGILSNRLVGITVMPHVDNFRPSWFHSRDYGLIVANPFGQKAFTKGESSSVPAKNGASFKLRYAAFIYSVPTNQQPDIGAVSKRLDLW